MRGPDSPQQVLTTTGTMQTTHWRRQHYKWNEQNDRILLTDEIRSITTDLRYLSLTANNITAKLTNQLKRTGLRTFDWQCNNHSLDSDDDFRSVCRNVSHHHRKKSFSRLQALDQITLSYVTPRLKPFTVKVKNSRRHSTRTTNRSTF